MKSAAVPMRTPYTFSLIVLGHATTADMRMAVGPMLVHSAVTSKLKSEDEIAVFSTDTELPKRFQISVANWALRPRKGSIVLLLRNDMYIANENIIQEKNIVQKRKMPFR